jgi:pyridoxamine 5'-phosphate oxidase
MRRILRGSHLQPLAVTPSWPRSHHYTLNNTPLYTAAMTHIADLRKSYERAELNEDASHADPLKQFEQWLDEAITSEVPEPNAMTLATVGNDLRPSTRVVLIKGYDERGIVWFTNYESRKGQQLAGNPYAALQFHWVELERVVRIEGEVEKVSDEESDAYFHSRPLDSRIGAWASPQSQVISGRSVLVANAAKFGAQFLLQPPRPAHWGGYRLKPDTWEFWQGRKSRLHDRLRYRLGHATDSESLWIRERLAP